MNKALKAAWFAAKVGAGVGVVYVTVDQGVWGDSRRAAAVYDRLYATMPGTKNVTEKLPKKDDVNINFRSHWNNGVFYTFDFIANIPAKIGGLKDAVTDFVAAPAPKKSDTPKAEAKQDETKTDEPAPADAPSPPEETAPSTPPEEAAPPSTPEEAAPPSTPEEAAPPSTSAEEPNVPVSDAPSTDENAN